jgi:hypothetical protein
MAKDNKRSPKAETAELLPIAFKKACEFVRQGMNITPAIKKSGMSEKSFYRYATEEMRSELKRLSSLNNKSTEEEDY